MLPALAPLHIQPQCFHLRILWFYLGIFLAEEGHTLLWVEINSVSQFTWQMIMQSTENVKRRGRDISGGWHIIECSSSREQVL